MTFTKNDGQEDEEYVLENCRPIKLRDDLMETEREHSTSEKSFTNWRIQVGEDREGESANKPMDLGGITRQTDVYLKRN